METLDGFSSHRDRRTGQLGITWDSPGCGCCSYGSNIYGNEAIEWLQDHISVLQQTIEEAQALIEEIRASQTDKL